MIAALALAVALAVQEAGLSHRARLEPDVVEVGRPFRVVVEVEHPPGVLPRALEPELEDGAPWVALGARTERAGPRATTLTYRLAALEPGDAALPPLAFAVRDAAGSRAVPVDAPAPDVRGALADGEDAPRSLRPFRELEGDASAGARGPARLAAAAAALGLLALVVLSLAARARALLRARAPRAPSPAERLAALERAAGGARARLAALAALLREALDERAGRDRRALTDDEWALAIEDDPGLGAEDRAAARALIAGAREVKYAGAVPTDFALAEALERARRILAGEAAR